MLDGAVAVGRESRGVGPRARTWLSPSRLPITAVLIAGTVYAVVFLIELHTILAGLYRNGDVAFPAQLAQALHSGVAHGRVVIGNHPWYEELLGTTVASRLPGYRTIVLLAPLVWDLVGLAILGWATARAFGRAAALISVVAVACLGQLGRQAFLSWDFHALPMFHVLLIGGALVYAARFDNPLAHRRVLVGALVLGLLSPLPTASDELFIAWGLVPLLGASLLLFISRRDRRSRQLLGLSAWVCAIAVAGGEGLAALMRSAGFVGLPTGYELAPISGWVHNAWTLLQSLTSLIGGDFFGIASDGTGVWAVIRGIIGLGLLALALWVTARFAVGLLRRRPQPGTATFLHLTFWGLALVANLAVFIVSTVASSGPGTGRYLLAAYVASAALIAGAGLSARSVKVLFAPAVVLLVVGAVIGLASDAGIPQGSAPGRADAAALERYVTAEHATVGYASYWAAASLSWETRSRLLIVPIHPCSLGGPDVLCPDKIGVQSWYRPGHSRSFLMVDSRVPWITEQLPTGPWSTGVGANLGTPVAHTDIGGMRIYVYAYDIVNRLCGGGGACAGAT